MEDESSRVGGSNLHSPPVEEGGAESRRARRILALDVGDRRIGLALSDELGYTAQPLWTLHRTNHRGDLKAIGRVLRKYAVSEVVVGNPLHMSGDQSPQAAKAQAFAADVGSGFGVTVHLWDERLTTTEAHRHLDDAGHGGDRRERKGIIDQVAAVLILEAFLAMRAMRRARMEDDPPGCA